MGKSRLENIIDAINLLLIKEYPDHEVHIDLLPKGFKRPCFLIEPTRSTTDPINKYTVKRNDYFTIVIFDEVDDYSNTNTLDLLSVQEGVKDIFECGYIKVGDRAIEIASSDGGRNYDRAYVDLQLNYFDDRKIDREEYDLMTEVDIKIKEE